MQRIRFVTGKSSSLTSWQSAGGRSVNTALTKPFFAPERTRSRLTRSAEDRANRVDDDTLARAGLAGEHGQSALQLDVRALDHGNIFNVE